MKRFLWFLLASIFLFVCPSAALPTHDQQKIAPAPAPNPELDKLVNRAESLVARKMFVDAIDVYRQCLELSPRDASLYNRLGVAYHRNQDFREAKKSYERAIKLDPHFAEAFNNLGTIAFSEKKYGRAIKYYKKALKIRPEASTMHYNLASAYFAKEDYSKAFVEYQTAITQDPDLMEHISATGNLVRTAAFNQAKYHFFLAKIYAEIGDNDRAIDYLTRAFEEGFKDKDEIFNDRAFAALIKDQKFTRLIQNPPKPIE